MLCGFVEWWPYLPASTVTLVLRARSLSLQMCFTQFCLPLFFKVSFSFFSLFMKCTVFYSNLQWAEWVEVREEAKTQWWKFISVMRRSRSSRRCGIRKKQRPGCIENGDCHLWRTSTHVCGPHEILLRCIQWLRAFWSEIWAGITCPD